MTEQSAPDASGAQNNEPPQSDTQKLYESLTQASEYYGAPDRVLQKLADSADAGGLGQGIPVTLFLQGSMMAGHTVSGQEFYRAMADLFREGVANVTADGALPEYADEYAQMAFGSVADDIAKGIADDDRAFDENGTKTARWLLTRHLYLKDAYYTVPGAASVNREYVCVKLSQIVGWTFGVTTWGTPSNP